MAWLNVTDRCPNIDFSESITDKHFALRYISSHDHQYRDLHFLFWFCGGQFYLIIYLLGLLRRYRYKTDPLRPSDDIWQHSNCSTIMQIMAWFWKAPGHDLNKCCLILNEVQWHSSKGPGPLECQWWSYIKCKCTPNYVNKIIQWKVCKHWTQHKIA